MPLYEYECEKCHRRTEKIENVNGPHLKKCPHCGGKVERLVSSSAIQFKGSGWYVTDYAGKKSSTENAGAEKSNSQDSSSAKDSSSKDSSKDSSSKESSSKSSSKESSSSSDSKDKKPAKRKD